MLDYKRLLMFVGYYKYSVVYIFNIKVHIKIDKFEG